jgi:DNA-binding CsgD family transcriptional regulator
VFQSFRSLFFYDGQTVVPKAIEPLPLNLFRIGDTLYSQRINSGMGILTGQRITPWLERTSTAQSNVVAVLPYDDALLLLTCDQGGFICRHGQTTPWHTECDAELKRHIINRAVMTKDSCYVIGTISNGLYAIDKRGRLCWQENADNLLPNNTVLGLCCDHDNNIWAALDQGVAYIQSASPLTYYRPSKHGIGMTYDVLMNGTEAYIASNQGLYHTNGGEQKRVPEMGEQAWFVERWGNQLFCGHNTGTYQLDGTHATLVSSVRGGVCLQKIYLDDKPYLLEGSYSTPVLYQQDATGRWQAKGALRGFSHMVSNIEQDGQGNIWAQHMRKGFYRFRIDVDSMEVTDLKRYTTLGDRKDNSFALFKVHGRVVFSNGDAFYTYDDMHDSIIPYLAMNRQLAELKEIHTVCPTEDDRYWFMNDRTAYLVAYADQQFRILHRITFDTFAGQEIEEKVSAHYDDHTGYTYFCLYNALARIGSYPGEAPPSPTAFRRQPTLSIVRMEASDDRNDSLRILPIHPHNRIEASFSTLRFLLAYPAYNRSDYHVRYLLQGFSDQWQEGGHSLQKSYPRLPFGRYLFKAEVYDGDGMVAHCELPFELLRPWYLSYTLITLYLLLALLLLFALQYAIYRHVKRKKDHYIARQQILHQAELERREKEIAELRKEQLEADLRAKSTELSKEVITNIAHQEFLGQLKEEIQRQKLSGQYTRRNLDKLLGMVNSNILSDEESWNIFQANFDRIHENFFRNLKLSYPTLTAGDLRFCALLRLNLPTKEIAGLMNISIRGVDAARYRLRKKFDLSPEEGLVEFLIGLHGGATMPTD